MNNSNFVENKDNGISEQKPQTKLPEQNEINSGMAEISSYLRGETEASGKPFSGSQPSKSEQEHSGNRQEIIKIT